jgi:hypothetical protein
VGKNGSKNSKLRRKIVRRGDQRIEIDEEREELYLME